MKTRAAKPHSRFASPRATADWQRDSDSIVDLSIRNDTIDTAPDKLFRHITRTRSIHHRYPHISRRITG